jgi:hypothetical protein
VLPARHPEITRGATINTPPGVEMNCNSTEASMNEVEPEPDLAETEMVHWSPRRGPLIGSGRPAGQPPVPSATAAAVALGAVALGAFAIGALAIGALSIGRMAVGRARLKEVRIGRLIVDELTVRKRTA